MQAPRHCTQVLTRQSVLCADVRAGQRHAEDAAEEGRVLCEQQGSHYIKVTEELAQSDVGEAEGGAGDALNKAWASRQSSFDQGYSSNRYSYTIYGAIGTCLNNPCVVP